MLAESDAPVAPVARVQRDFARAYVLWASGDLSATLEKVNAIAAAVDSYPASWHFQTVMGVVDFYQSLGRIRDRNRFAEFAEE